MDRREAVDRREASRRIRGPRTTRGALAYRDAREPGTEPVSDHVVRELSRRCSPKGKQQLQAGVGEVLFAIPPDVLQEEIPESRVSETVSNGARDSRPYPLLVDLVGTWMRYAHGS